MSGVRAALVLTVTLIVVACGSPPGARLAGPQRLVLLHTADTHAQIFPWRTLIGSSDARRGLGEAGTVSEVGGYARLKTLLRRERAGEARVLHLDAGDLFQGSLAFERFGGEPEILGFDALGVDAQALGNHELDRGEALVHDGYRAFARFPLLAVNYVSDGGGGLTDVLGPFVVLDAAGLRVGVIGVGNTSTVALLGERPNDLRALAEDASEAVQGAIDALRPVVDLVVVVTHLGLDADETLVARTSGIDVVLGGHQHLTLDAPKWAQDCSAGVVRDAWGGERSCASRRVPIVHSGAYGKYIGRLALELDDDAARFGSDYDPLDRYEVAALDFSLIPVPAETPDDPDVAELLAPFRTDGDGAAGVRDVLAYAPAALERYGATGADSPLGNLAAEAVRAVAAADLAVIGASSLRHDLPAGPLDLEELVAVAPFEDPVVRAELTGVEVAAMFEQAARSASGRDCRTQVHVANALVRFVCPCEGERCARAFTPETSVQCGSDADCSAFGGACSGRGTCFAPLDPQASYAVATTEYLAAGGSGLFAPIAETVRLRLNDGLSETLADFLRGGPGCTPAGSACSDACPAALTARSLAACAASGTSDACVGDTQTACARAVDACGALPCADATRGATRDGRIRFEAP